MQSLKKTLSLSITIIIFIITACSQKITSGKKAYELGDYQKAVKLYTKEAKQGDAKAKYRLGYMYQYGQGVEHNYKKAIEYYTQSAKQGNQYSQFNLWSRFTSILC